VDPVFEAMFIQLTYSSKGSASKTNTEGEPLTSENWREETDPFPSNPVVEQG
jgi:hypothetical protein